MREYDAPSIFLITFIDLQRETDRHRLTETEREREE